jgi:hypothetical protein
MIRASRQSVHAIRRACRPRPRHACAATAPTSTASRTPVARIDDPRHADHWRGAHIGISAPWLEDALSAVQEDDGSASA